MAYKKKLYGTRLDKIQEEMDNQVHVVEVNGKKVSDAPTVNTSKYINLAPIKETAKANIKTSTKITNSKKSKEDSSKGILQKGALSVFDDGYDFGDITKTILGGSAATVGDIGLNVTKGAVNIVEGVADVISYGVAGVADLIGKDDYAENVRKRTQVSLVDKFTKKADDYLDQYSYTGELTDNISQGIGTVGSIILTGGLGSAAGLGTAGTTALTTGVMGASSMGSGMSEAYRSGATDGQAFAYGTIAGLAEAGTELLFGGLGKAVNAVGLSKGLSSLDDALAKKVSSKISNQITKNFAEYGIKAGAEGFEEVASGFMQALGKKATYMSEEELGKILEDENLLEQFVTGAITSGIAQSGYVPGMKQGSLIEANKTGRDFISGYTQNEQKVIDSLVNEQVNGIAKKNALENELNKAIESKETEQGGILSTKEKNALKSKIQAQIDSGEIDISSTKVSNKDISKIREAVEENMQKGLLDTNTIESVLGTDTDLSNDGYLQKSYIETAKKKEAFTYENKITDAKEKAVYESAAKYFNNTTRSHEFVERVAKISKDKGTNYGFINNEELQTLGHDVEGKQVNGLVRTNKNGEQTVLINVDSPKALETIVGHETTHLLEGTQEYKDLQEAIFNYAKEKGDFNTRQEALNSLYEGIENANVDSELTADLVGDYLFTDTDFINSLSTQKPTVFQRIKELIDDLVVRFTGTKEEKALREVQKKFKEAYKQNVSNTNENVDKYSLNKMEVIGGIYKNVSLKKGEPSQNKKKLEEYVKKNFPGYDIEFDIFNDTEFTIKSIKENTKSLNDEINFKHNERPEYDSKEWTDLEDIRTRIETLTKELDKSGEFGDYGVDYEESHASPDATYIKLEDNEGETRTIRVANHSDSTGLSDYHLMLSYYKSKTELINDLKKLIYDIRDGKSDIKYSLTDNQGRTLSKEQQEYFKNSKVRDDNGNLEVVYHSTPNEFTVFDNSMSGENTGYDNTGFGTFVTTNKAFSERFKDIDNKGIKGNTMELYANVTNPITHPYKAGLKYGEEQANKIVEDYYNALGDTEALATMQEMIEDEEADSLYDAYMQFAQSEDIYEYASTEKEILQSNGYDAVEIIEGYESELVDGSKSNEVVSSYAIFNSNQLKNLDNTNPTDNPDINLSLSNQNEAAPTKNPNLTYGEDVKLQVEETIAPLKEQINELTEQLTNNTTDNVKVSENPNMEQIAPIQEEVYLQEYLSSPTSKNIDGFDYSKHRTKIINKANNDIVDLIDNTSNENMLQVLQKAYEENEQHIGNKNPANGIYNGKYEDAVLEYQHKESILSGFMRELQGVYGKNNNIKDTEMYKLLKENQNTHKNLAINEFAPIPQDIVEQQNKEAFKNIDDSNMPSEVEDTTPDNEAKMTTSKSLFETRDYADVGNRKVNAYQYDNPEVKPYFQEAAQLMLYDLDNSIKGERIYNDEAYYNSNGEIGWQGTKRQTTDDIAELLDGMNGKFKYTYADIEKGLNAIINDEGAENNAASKRIEMYLDQRLRQGYTTVDGFEIPANQEYIDMMAANEITDTHNNMLITDDLAPVENVDNIVDNVSNSEFVAPVKENALNFEKTVQELGEKNNYISNKADELYTELKGLKKGVRASEELGTILDLGYEWRRIKNALLNIKYKPDSIVDINSSIESTIREMIGRDYEAKYENMMYGLEQPNQNLSIKESNVLKLKNLEQSIKKYNNDAQESLELFDELILEKKQQYSELKRKDTNKANNLLQQITNLETRRDNIQVEYERKMNNVQKRIDNMNSKDFKTAEQRMTKQQEYREQARELIGDTSTWKDKKLGIQYQINTFKRNLRDIVKDAFGKADIQKADAIYEEYQGKYNQNEAKLKVESNKIKQPYVDLNLTKQEDAYVQMLGEFKYNPDTTITKKVVDDYYNEHKDKIDINKVDKAIESARKTYDSLHERLNEVLRNQGMKEIGYRQGYFPHFTEEKQSMLAKLFDWKVHNNQIPTDIAGLTELNNPERSWQSFNKQRKGDTTDYSFSKGLDTYVHGALDWIYHIEDIQKRRAFENEIRYQHSEKGVQEKIEAIYSDPNLDADEIQAQIEAVYGVAKNPLNNFVTDLRNSTNNLAGKKSTLDRSMEYATNRQIYSTMTNLSNRVSGNLVGGSISSALTNFIPITQSWAEVSPLSSLNASREVLKNTIKDDGTIAKSTFLTNRLIKEENLYKSNWDKARDVVGFMMDAIDSFTSQVVWRSKYNENLKNGMNEFDAIANADQFAENVMAGRSRGNQPTIFDSKNPITKMFTSFQLEVNNGYQYMFKDMPIDIGNKSKAKLIKGYATMFLGAYVYNALYSTLTGRDAAFDPIGIVEDILKELGIGGDDEDEKSASEKFTAITEDLVQDLPFVGGLFGGGRVPISAAIPYDNPIKMFSGTATDALDAIAPIFNKDEEVKEKGEKALKDLTSEWLKPVTYLALPFGGGQISKSIKGLSMYDSDLPIAGSYNNSGDLRFTADDGLPGIAKSFLFGQYASESAQDYVDSGFKTIGKDNVEEMISLDMDSTEYRNYRNGLSKNKTIGEKLDYITNLDVTDKQKIIMIDYVASQSDDDFAPYKGKGKLEVTDNYIVAGNREYYKYIDNEGNEKWSKVDEEEAADLNSLGFSASGKNAYFSIKEEISSIANEYLENKDDLTLDNSSDEYKEAIKELSSDKKASIIDKIKNTGLNDKQKAYLYGKYYSSDETLEKVTNSGISFDNYLNYEKDSLSLESTEEKVEYLYNSKMTDDAKTVIYETSVLTGFDNEDKYKAYKTAKAAGIDIDSWLSYKKQEFVADKDSSGKSISGSRKDKIFNYINSLSLSIPQKAILFRQEYPSDDTYNNQIVNYVGSLNISYEDKVNIFEELDMTVGSDGRVYWK